MRPVTLGFAMTGSFCTHAPVLRCLRQLRETYPNIVPILSENAYFLDSRFGPARDRIAELEDILLHVVIIDESEGASNAVSIGCTVTVVDLKTGREMPPYKVVGSQEADPMHRAISEESPFGKALMGAKEGDEISVEAPVGIIHYRVEKIER